MYKQGVSKLNKIPNGAVDTVLLSWNTFFPIMLILHIQDLVMGSYVFCRQAHTSFRLLKSKPVGTVRQTPE